MKNILCAIVFISFNWEAAAITVGELRAATDGRIININNLQYVVDVPSVRDRPPYRDDNEEVVLNHTPYGLEFVAEDINPDSGLPDHDEGMFTGILHRVYNQ